MLQISFKKIVIAIVIVVVLSKLDRILALFCRTYLTVYDSLEPLRKSSDTKFLVTVGILSLVFVTIFCLLNKRL
jgi:hypothetical protein